MDIVGAAVGLVFFSPALLLTALYVKLVSPGPVFADMPKRVGRGGRLFR
ncbi:MAG: sugar transferase, partial [Proteobacteria bacterium]|nr:sugar transferase [Pseudomonadota bacterium]